jgi:transposase-like protein
MQTEEKNYTTKVSDSFDQTDEKCSYEVPFRRWLIKEIEEGRLTTVQAIERFNFHPVSGHNLIYKWRAKYSQEMVLALPSMTEKEKKEMLAMQQRLKQLEDELEDASMRNIALNMLIDVAEDKLKINIRKKPGAKQ